MPLTEYDTTDALGLAGLVRNRDITAGALVEEAIARAEKRNPQLNAVVFKAYDQARERADGEQRIDDAVGRHHGGRSPDGHTALGQMKNHGG